MTARKPLELATIVASILAAEQDGNEEDIVTALAERRKQRDGVVGWKIVLGDLTVTVEDMTFGDFNRVRSVTGAEPIAVDPAQNVGQAVLILALHLARRDNITVSEAVEQVEARPFVASVRFSEYEMPAPLGGGATSTI